MGTGLALATDVTSALRSCFSLAMDCLYPRDPPQPVREKKTFTFTRLLHSNQVVAPLKKEEKEGPLATDDFPSEVISEESKVFEAESAVPKKVLERALTGGVPEA